VVSYNDPESLIDSLLEYEVPVADKWIGAI
jgi:hypothetical protein